MGWDERDHKRFCHLARVGGGGLNKNVPDPPPLLIVNDSSRIHPPDMTKLLLKGTYIARHLNSHRNFGFICLAKNGYFVKF